MFEHRIRPAPLAAALLLAAFALLCVDSAWDKAAGYDEPGLILSGYSYLTSGSRVLPTRNLCLAEMWTALPVLALRPSLPSEMAAGSSGRSGLVVEKDPSDLGPAFVYDPRNDSEALLWAARLPVTAVAVLLGALLFHWSRRLHGDGAGLLTLALYCFSPLVISSGSLATTDLITTFLFAVAAAAFWRLLHRFTVASAALAGLAFGALLATKFSGLAFPLMAAVMLAIRVAAGPLPVPWKKLAGLLVLAGVVAYAILWVPYGFRYSQGVPAAAWVSHTRGLTGAFVRGCRAHRLLPEAYLYDFDGFRNTLDRRMFLLGRYSTQGWWLYFPAAVFFKEPLPMLASLLAGGVALAVGAARRRTASRLPVDFYGLTPFFAVGSVYGLLAAASHFNIGLRHLLPIYPALFMVAGAAACLPYPRWLSFRAVLALVVAASVAVLVGIRPNYLEYFNPFAGGSNHGYRVLLDSSCEWGQDLPAVRHWLEKRGPSPDGRPVYFAYDGNADIPHYRIPALLLPQDPERRKAPLEAIGPGTYVISANLLGGLSGGYIWGPWLPVYEQAYRELLRELGGPRSELPDLPRKLFVFERLRFFRLCAYLRLREPAAHITPGVLVYEVGPKQLQEALFGPLPHSPHGDVIEGWARR